MVRKENILFLGFVILGMLVLSLVSAGLPIYVKPVNSTNGTFPNTQFPYVFNFSTDIACTNVILSKQVNITTDSDGVGFADVDVSGLSQIPSYMCEYRNGTLRKNHTLSEQLFRYVYIDIIYAKNWSNISGSADIVSLPSLVLTESQISDLSHTVDTSAYVNCSGDNVLLGNGSCQSTSVYFDDTDTDTQKKTNNFYLYNDSSTIFFNETQLNSTIDNRASSNQSWNESYADTLYIASSNEGNLNVNSSGYWDNLNTFNSTQMENSAGILQILESWLTSFINTWFSGKTTNDLSEGSTNKYDNQSWNESYADTLYSTGPHTVDTSASVNCSGTTTYLDGEGNCDDISGVYVDESELPLANRTKPHWNNVTGKPANLDTDSTDDLTSWDSNLSWKNASNTFTENQVFNQNITVKDINVTNRRYLGACYETWNGSCLNTYCSGNLIQSIGCV